MKNKKWCKKIIRAEDKTFALAYLEELKIAKTNVRQTNLATKTEEVSIKNLKESIKKQGVLQLPVSDPQGNVFIGGQRVKAAKMANKTVIWVEVRDISEEDQRDASFAENKRRNGISILEEARYFFDKSQTKTVPEISEATDVSESRIKEYLQIYEVFSNRRAVADGEHKIEIYRDEDFPKKEDSLNFITYTKARELSKDYVEAKDRQRLIHQILKEGIMPERLSEIITESKQVKDFVESLDLEEDQKKKIKALCDASLFQKDFDLKEVMHQIRHIRGGAPVVKPYPTGIVLSDDNYLASRQQAEVWFAKLGGRCFGQSVYYYGEVDPVKLRRYKQELMEQKKHATQVGNLKRRIMKRKIKEGWNKISWKECEEEAEETLAKKEQEEVHQGLLDEIPTTTEGLQAFEKEPTEKGLGERKNGREPKKKVKRMSEESQESSETEGLTDSALEEREKLQELDEHLRKRD